MSCRQNPAPALLLLCASAALVSCSTEDPAGDAAAAPQSGTAAVSASDPRDLSGVWWNQSASVVDLQIVGEPPALSAAGESRFRESAERKRQIDAAASDVTDIRNCVPVGVPRIWAQPYPMEIAQRSDVTALMYEQMHSFRIVHMNEALPEIDDVPSLQRNGHSVGHWEGDTLIIESTAFLDSIVLNEQGLPASEQMRTVERLRKIDDGQTLEVVITVDDPQMYEQPWTVRAALARQPDDAALMEYTCGYGVYETRYVTLP